MKYILAKHTGKGFYTHEDRVKMPIFRYSNGMAIVDGDSAEWIARVRGQEITEAEAKTRMENEFNADKTREITEKTQELNDLKNKVYDYKDFTISKA